MCNSLMAECTGYNFISDLRHVGTNKTDYHDIAEILLKMVLKTTTRNENDVYNVLYAYINMLISPSCSSLFDTYISFDG
jgi:hypothetical protein